MNNPFRVSGFFGNIGHESSDLNDLEENLNYSAKRLMEVWPTRFRTADQAAKYARNPQALANNVYAGRMGNGNEASGDGWRFRGRGPLQLTGRHNYTKASEYLNIDFVGNPDQVATVEFGTEAALWFFVENGLFQICDTQNWDLLTRRINGGTHGHDDRIKRINAALRSFDDLPRSRPLVRRGSRGSDVADVQSALGISPNDGIFGPGTEKAVKEWQSANNLTADGIVGPASWAVIDQA
jgi:putative chitinase